MRLELFLGSQARLKSHFMGTGPEDGSDTKLHLEVQEVVPRILEEQVLKKDAYSQVARLTFIAISTLHSRNAGVCSSHQKQVHRIESAEFLCYDSMARRAGIQQRGHQSGYVQTCVP